MSMYLVKPDQLQAFCQTVMSRAGLSETAAKDVADLLISADLRGVRSHGVLRVKQYIGNCEAGGANKTPNIQVLSETETTAVMDADYALGGVSSGAAVRLAREKAAKHGIGMVSVKNCNHFGMAGHWSLKLAGDDMIGISASTVSPNMPAPGGILPVVGNNPFSIAVSGNKYKELCVDMASSVCAAGKAMDLMNQGKEIPMGWFFDEKGEPTNDMKNARMMAPFAGHKGYGIAIAVELFSGMLSGGALPQNMNGQGDRSKPELANQVFIAVNISAFRRPDEFRAALDSYIDFIKTSPLRQGVDGVKYPGEIEYNTKLNTQKTYITLNPKVAGELAEIADGFNIPKEEYAFLTALTEEKN